MKGQPIAVLGATGNVGRALVAALGARGAEIVAIARTVSDLQSLGGAVHPRAIDLDGDEQKLREALEGVSCVINVAHARFTRKIIAALPHNAVRLITLGSTRKFTRFPDQKAAQMQDAEAAHAQGVNGIILHPTMIYGGADNNISRILKIVRWTPLVPLPQQGRALLQPVHRNDVVRCLLAAISADTGNAPIIIAGAQAMTYARIIQACGRSVGRRVRVISVPFPAMIALAWLTRCVPGVAPIARDEVRRLLEDKAFDIGPMQVRLGVKPCTFEEGLARMRGG
ncbi:MAG: NAD-dependent epimerase/dehydratase family protein [Pseudomonadota bacterium]